jgi:uncharacterized small protein (DUF1192 family)
MTFDFNELVKKLRLIENDMIEKKDDTHFFVPPYSPSQFKKRPSRVVSPGVFDIEKLWANVIAIMDNNDMLEVNEVNELKTIISKLGEVVARNEARLNQKS